LSNCYAEAFGYDNHNRQRGNDEPAATEEVDMVVGAVLNSGATSAIKSASTNLPYYSTSVRMAGIHTPPHGATGINAANRPEDELNA
jgi:hypothetical protein